jgi:hypothetical protein
MEVEKVMDEWPESAVRRREWVSIDEACVRIQDQGLKALVGESIRSVQPADKAQ